MISPSPTQQPPDSAKLEQKKVAPSPSTNDAGQKRKSSFGRRFLRAILRAIYYCLQAMRNHKRLTFVAIVLLLISIAVTNFFATGQTPLGIGQDQFNFRVNGTHGGGEQVKNWLYALREGNVTQLSLLEKNMSQPPDPNELVTQFSQKSANLTWKSITVIGVHSNANGLVDSFVQVEYDATGPGGKASGTTIWHFVTVPQGGGAILAINLVMNR